MNATQNLALYCASAILEDLPAGDYAPPLPHTNEQSCNNKYTLAAAVEPWRKLTYINMWQQEKFDEATQHAFANTMNVPTWDLRVPEFDPETRSIATMSAGRQFVTLPNHLPLPEGVQGIREWVYHLPLRTAERVMNLVNRNSESWCLDINQASIQFSHLYASCAWGPRLEQAVPGSASTSRRVMPNLLFVIQSPWLLNSGDFRMFCERSMYRHYAKKDPKTGKVEVTELDYVDKLWASIYDDCVRGGTHYFVLTTYNQWTFGAFSRGWTTAWVTPPKPYDAGSPTVPGPTVLQSILFWMHSARQFYFDSYGVTRTPSLEGPGLPTPITPTSHHSRSPSLTPSESELDLDSETDDNTLDKGWLDEMRTSVREIKVLKGALKLGRTTSGSWVIPEIWEDMEPPKIPPKRAVYVIETDDESSDPAQDGWYHKRQRRTNDQYGVNRRVSTPPRPIRNRRRPTNDISPPDISSTQANTSISISSIGTDKTRIFPGSFQAGFNSTSDAFHRILRSRRRGKHLLPEQPAVTPDTTTILLRPPSLQPIERTFRLPTNHLPAFELTDSFDEVQIRDENERPPGPIVLAPPPHLSLPQTTVAIGGHTIELTRPRLRPRLMSGIRLDQPTSQAWPPPRQPFTPLLVETHSDSDATEIDPDAQRRPECGFRDSSPSIHANDIYEM
ncbi:hypothetical protein RSOLAG1IB_00679 [Rhizoctonia solani AG-1 IB]|uniref:Uncharacterized protein n=1 Tax=Thanatephorus cucumeris (strain AG1-IB / isolate 7/3/14) TaxID=1108050 RepID=A0A0B7F269_THACB|nr:hypothetical protein RSOLAG1IB_00679 [Rhizoctonia solani AG-1 IB]